MKYTLLTFLLFSCTYGFSQIWTGGANDHDWSNANNWDTNTIPISTSNVIINGDSVWLPVTTSIKSLELVAEAVLYIEKADLSVEDDIFIDDFSRLTIDLESKLLCTSSDISTIALTNEGTLLNYGILEIDPSTSQNTIGVLNRGLIYNHFTFIIDSGCESGLSNQPQASVYNLDGSMSIHSDDNNGIFSAGYFYNDSQLSITGTARKGLNILTNTNFPGSSLFENYDQINITGPGPTNPASAQGGLLLNNNATLHNHGSGTINIDQRVRGINNEGIINNSGAINVTNGFYYGVHLKGTLTNNGDVNVSTVTNLGMEVHSTASLNNNSTGKISLTSCDVPIEFETSFQNNGEIEVVNCQEGLYFPNISTFTNTGVLRLSGLRGVFSRQVGSDVINTSTSTVYSSALVAFDVYDAFSADGTVFLTRGGLVDYVISPATYTHTSVINLSGIADYIIENNGSENTKFIISGTGSINSSSTEQVDFPPITVNYGQIAFADGAGLNFRDSLVNISTMTFENVAGSSIESINGSFFNASLGTVVLMNSGGIVARKLVENQGSITGTNSGAASSSTFRNFGSISLTGGGGVSTAKYQYTSSKFENHSGTINLTNSAVSGISIQDGTGFNNGTISGNASGTFSLNNVVSPFINNGTVDFAGTLSISATSSLVNESTGVLTFNTTNSSAITNYGTLINKGIMNAFGQSYGILCNIGSTLEIDGNTQVKAPTGIGIDLRANTTFSLNSGNTLTISDFLSYGIFSLQALTIDGNLNIGNTPISARGTGIHCFGLTLNSSLAITNVANGLYVNAGDLVIQSTGNCVVDNCVATSVSLDGISGISVSGNLVVKGRLDIKNILEGALECQDLNVETGTILLTTNIGKRAAIINGNSTIKSTGQFLIENASFGPRFHGIVENFGTIYTQSSGSIFLEDSLINHNSVYVESGVSDGVFTNPGGVLRNLAGGQVTVDGADRYGISGEIYNEGDIDVGGTTDVALYTLLEKILNKGNILIRNSVRSGIVVSNDSLINTANGIIRFLNTDENAIFNAGVVINNGQIIVEDCKDDAIRNQSATDFQNSGLIWIKKGNKGGILNVNSDFTNKTGGKVLIEAVISSSISSGTADLVKNERCGTIFVNSNLNARNFRNDGYLSYSYVPNTFSQSLWYDGFVNNGVFVERSGQTGLENDFTNNGYAIFPLTGIVKEGELKYNVIYQGSAPVYSINTEIHINPSFNNQEGEIDGNTIVLSDNALNADSLYFQFTTSGCMETIALKNNFTDNCTGIGLDLIFEGAISNNWHNPFNWNIRRVPEECDNVVIPTGKNVQIESANKAYSSKLLVEPGAVYEAQPGSVQSSQPID